MSNFGPIGTLPINASRRAPTSTAYTNFLADTSQESIFFLELRYRSRNELDPLTSPPAGINTLPINVTRSSELFTPSDGRMLFSSKNWIGLPTDTVRPNTAARRRLIEAFRVRRTTPYFPSDESRIQTSIASATLSNPDGDLSFLAIENTTEGYVAPIWHWPLDCEFGAMGLLVQPTVRGVETSGDELVVQFGTSSSIFSNLFMQRSRFGGAGGIDGDIRLRGALKPLLFGSVYHMEPVALYAAALIWMVNAGPIVGIGPVWDGGSPIPLDRDYETFAALAAATIPPGHYATCLKAGCFRLRNAPLHALRCSVRGSLVGGVYLQDAGQILLHTVTTLAARPTSIFNISSFGQLSKAPIGWYNQQRDFTIEDFINEVLRPENAALGESADGRIGIIKHRPPSSQSTAQVISVRPAQVEVRLLSYTPYSSQTVRYGRNWAPLSESEFADGIPEIDRAQFRDEWQTVTDTSGLVSGFANVSSVDSEKDTLLARDETVAAQLQANQDIQLFGRTTVGLSITGLGRKALRFRDGEVVRLIVDKFGFEAGRNVVIVSVDQAARGEVVDLEVIA